MSPDPQSVVIVLPRSGLFDSRSQRIAAGLAARGHAVTLTSRREPGQATREIDPAGYTWLRVDADPYAALPLPDTVRERARAASWEYRGFGRQVCSVASAVAQRRATLSVAPAADVYHGMAFFGIPIALALRDLHGGRAVYDAQDIYTSARNLARLPGFVRAPVAWVERGWARRADAVLTANEAYATVLGHRFGRPPIVVGNSTTPFDPPRVPERRFHAALGLPPSERIVLYHGGLERERGIEQLIEAIPAVPQATLVLMGYGPIEAEVRARAADRAAAGRVRVMPAVPPSELLPWVASADVAAMPIQPSTLNHRLTTPNKLFEAMAAGVPVLAADLPGMRPIVRQSGCGLLVDPTDPATIARALTEMLDAPEPQRAAWKAGGLAAARGRYSWESQFDRLLAAYGELTGRPW